MEAMMVAAFLGYSAFLGIIFSLKISTRVRRLRRSCMSGIDASMLRGRTGPRGRRFLFMSFHSSLSTTRYYTSSRLQLPSSAPCHSVDEEAQRCYLYGILGRVVQ